MKLLMLKGTQVWSAPSLEPFKKKKGRYCKVSDFIEIKKIN